MGAGRMDIPDARYHGWQLLGLLRAGLGWLVVLGSSRKRVADALAGGDRLAPFGDGTCDARRIARVDADAGSGCFFDVDDRNLSGTIRHIDQRARLCG